MSRFSKQFAIIHKIKSIVKGRTDKAVLPSANQESISQKIANRIQNTAYEHLKSKSKKDSYTPTYLVIAEQLGVDNNQIFFAAVFTLSRIAVSKKSYKKPILDILTNTLKDNNDNEDRTSYVSQKIDEIKSLSI